MKPHMCRYENTLILVHLVLVLALNTLRTTVSTVSTSWYGGGGGVPTVSRAWQFKFG